MVRPSSPCPISMTLLTPELSSFNESHVKEILQSIISSPRLEARWLATLSVMEGIGARKICLTVCQSHPTQEVLKHFADESRHAYAFKRLSELVGKNSVQENLCGDEAISYFQMLDAGVTDFLSDLPATGDQYANYLLVTSLIEKRAMKLYPLYLSVSQNPDVKDELKQIILEESDHKPGIEDAALDFLKKNGFDDMTHLEKLEDNLFGTFVSSLQKELRAAA